MTVTTLPAVTADMTAGARAYARAAISDLVGNGGFPPFQLQPINFDALYAEGLRQRAEQQGQADALQPGSETAGNA